MHNYDTLEVEFHLEVQSRKSWQGDASGTSGNSPQTKA